MHLHPKFVGLPDKFDIRPFDRLWMPRQIHAIPLRSAHIGAYASPKTNPLISLFLVLFSLIFKASKAEVARSNRAGQAKFISVYINLGW